LHGARDLRIEEVPSPREPGPREVLIRTHLCGICGTDLHEYADGPHLATLTPHPLTGASLPQILGHEFSAVVSAVGDGVTSVVPGDRVAIMPLFFCGECDACRRGQHQVCVKLGAVGLNWTWGGMGEYALVLEHQVAVLPEGVSDLQGALVEPAAVAINSVTKAGVGVGDTVLVTGGGPIGQLAGLAAVAAGAGAVILSEPNAARRTRAADLGFTAVLDPRATDVAATAHELFGNGVDVAIECAGNEPALNACIAAVRRGGTVMQTGLHVRPVQLNPRDLTLRDVSLVGANCFPVTGWPRVIRLMASGRLPVERIVTGRIDLADVLEQGFDALLDPSGGHVKILVTVDRG
jgi:(R,R)-butanediol dehydrogenase/meso-butanediol dehydrogenase/diacetyl reductase